MKKGREEQLAFREGRLLERERDLEAFRTAMARALETQAAQEAARGTFEFKYYSSMTYLNMGIDFHIN